MHILDRSCLLKAMAGRSTEPPYDEHPPAYPNLSHYTHVYYPAKHTFEPDTRIGLYDAWYPKHGGHGSWAHIHTGGIKLMNGPSNPDIYSKVTDSAQTWIRYAHTIGTIEITGRCRITSASASPNGPALADTTISGAATCTYLRAENPDTNLSDATFDLGPGFDPQIITHEIADNATIGLLFPENKLARVTSWTVSPSGETLTKPSNSRYATHKHQPGEHYTANYERLAYTVSLHANVPSDYVIQKFVVKPNWYLNDLDKLPERPGYAFSGTSDSPEPGVGQAYHDKTGRAIQRWTRTDDGDIFCHWDPKTYRITYTSDDIGTDDSLRRTYETGEGFALPTPSRYGYLFDGWEVSGAQGAGVETVTEADGTKTTHIKAGTYGDLTCTAKWVLRYDLAVPIADPGDVTFEADSLTGQVRVKPGTSATGSIISYIAAPIMLDTLSCEGPHSAEPTDPAEGASELEGIFGVGASSKVRFVVTLGDADAAQTAKLTIGSASSLAGLAIPAATSRDDPGRMPVTYGLELDADLAIPPVRDAAPVAQLTYTVSLAP